MCVHVGGIFNNRLLLKNNDIVFSIVFQEFLWGRGQGLDRGEQICNEGSPRPPLGKTQIIHSSILKLVNIRKHFIVPPD